MLSCRCLNDVIVMSLKCVVPNACLYIGISDNGVQERLGIALLWKELMIGKGRKKASWISQWPTSSTVAHVPISLGRLTIMNCCLAAGGGTLTSSGVVEEKRGMASRGDVDIET